MNLVAPILHFGRTRASTAALVDGANTFTYGELASLVLRTAMHLDSRGIRQGDRVGLCLRDGSDHLVALLAIAHLGAIGVSLDWRAPPAETARLIDGLGVVCILIEAAGRCVDGCPPIPLDADWHQAVAAADPSIASPAAWHDPFAISATSGSTGTPKLTLMTHSQYYFATVGMWELMGLAGRHRYLSTMPLYYSGGRNSCMTHLLRGDCVVLHHSLFAPADYVAAIRRHEITVAAVVPSMVRQLLTLESDAPLLGELSAFFCTGAPLHAEEKRQAIRQLTPVFHERYGTAETLAVSVLRPTDFADRPDSVGQPHSLAEIEIVDEGHSPVRCGTVGRLRIRGPGVGAPLPGNAAEANFRDGWFYPGEIARLDTAGYIFLQGRTSDVIIRSGAKIYPAEVEATLAEHPGVIDSAVLGERGNGNEEEIIAFVVKRSGVAAGELVAHCRSRLTPHKVPRRFHFLDSLPKNTAGKADKMALAALLKNGMQ